MPQSSGILLLTISCLISLLTTVNAEAAPGSGRRDSKPAATSKKGVTQVTTATALAELRSALSTAERSEKPTLFEAEKAALQSQFRAHQAKGHADLDTYEMAVDFWRQREYYRILSEKLASAPGYTHKLLGSFYWGEPKSWWDYFFFGSYGPDLLVSLGVYAQGSAEAKSDVATASWCRAAMLVICESIYGSPDEVEQACAAFLREQIPDRGFWGRYFTAEEWPAHMMHVLVAETLLRVKPQSSLLAEVLQRLPDGNSYIPCPVALLTTDAKALDGSLVQQRLQELRLERDYLLLQPSVISAILAWHSTHEAQGFAQVLQNVASDVKSLDKTFRNRNYLDELNYNLVMDTETVAAWMLTVTGDDNLAEDLLNLDTALLLEKEEAGKLIFFFRRGASEAKFADKEFISLADIKRWIKEQYQGDEDAHGLVLFGDSSFDYEDFGYMYPALFYLLNDRHAFEIPEHFDAFGPTLRAAAILQEVSPAIARKYFIQDKVQYLLMLRTFRDAMSDDWRSILESGLREQTEALTTELRAKEAKK